MPVNDIDILRKSKLVKRIVSSKFHASAGSYILKLRVELINGWLMDYWEHNTEKIRKHSYHVFLDNKMIVRWDNSPHPSRNKIVSPPQTSRKTDSRIRADDSKEGPSRTGRNASKT